MFWLYEALDGKTYVLDGVEGTLVAGETRYGRQGTLDHEATARGKRTKAYRDIRRQLGDDFVSNLTNSERIGEIAVAVLGEDELQRLLAEHAA